MKSFLKRLFSGGITGGAIATLFILLHSKLGGWTFILLLILSPVIFWIAQAAVDLLGAPMSRKVKIFIGILITGIILTGGYIKIKAEKARETIKALSAPEKVEIQDRTYILETKLWRDFMPFAPPDGKPLIVLAWVTAIDLSEFPSSLKVDRVWVINGKKLWQGKIADEGAPQGPGRKYQLRIIARGGPKWGPGISVDVVVRISDEQNRFYLLRATDQEIHRTE